jgi:hypothetical protein
MINNVNTQRPINHTLAVIDGGLNFKTKAPTPPTAPNPKLLDQVRRQSARGNIAIEPRRLTFIGSNVSSFFTTSGIQWKWGKRKSVGFFLRWQPTYTLARPPKIKPSTPCFFSIVKF